MIVHLMIDQMRFQIGKACKCKATNLWAEISDIIVIRKYLLLPVLDYADMV